MAPSQEESQDSGLPGEQKPKNLKGFEKSSQDDPAKNGQNDVMAEILSHLSAKKTSALDSGAAAKEEASGESGFARPQRTAKYIDDLITRAETPEKLEKVLNQEVNEILFENNELKNYSIVFLYDYNQISRLHASNLYQYLSSIKEKKDIFLILKSPGGEVEPAYLISKMCNRFKLNKFIIGIPAEAKSAATLLSLGGDELHMGAMSELGPIDPQINDFPALAFSGALEKITKLAHKYPDAAQMLAQYLIGSSLDVRALGHYERITESSTQYAMRLLKSKATSTDDDASAIEKLAEHFTNHYKDHNFVIDIDEAQTLLTTDVVKADTSLYSTCHEVYKFIETCEQIMAMRKINKRIMVLGSKLYLNSIEI